MELNIKNCEQFKCQLQSYILHYWKLHKKYSILNMSLIIAGLLVGAGITVTGFMQLDIWPGLLGALITLIIGLQNAFDLSGKALFLNVIHDEAKVLRDRLRYKVKTQEEFEAVIDEFSLLRIYAVKKLPLGSGMGVVKNGS